MFEQVLVPRTRDRRWGLKLGMAVGLHAAALGSVVMASNWGIDPVAPPPEMVVLWLPKEAPIEVTFPRAAPAPPAPAPATQPPPPRPTLGPTQPPVVPDTAPDAPPQQGSSSTTDTAESTTTDGSERTTTDTGGLPDGPGGPGDAAFGDDARPLDANMVPPVVLVRVTPRYTDRGRIAHIEGIVVLQATIDRMGRVTDVQVVKGLPLGLDDAAVTAVQQWRFQPATLHGRPVPVYFQLTVVFNIK